MTEARQVERPRDEVEQAFAHWWKVGCVDEDWAMWVDLFAPEVV